VSKVGIDDEIQSTVRLYPEAFLARSVLICEGASEVGFVRGVDLYRVGEGETSIAVNSVALVDCGGGDAERCFRRAAAFQNLGYRTAILRDSDIPVAVEVQDTFTDSGGTLITWRDECAIEDELFRSLTDGAVDELIDLAIELHGEDLIDQHIKTVSDGAANLDQIHANAREDGYSDEARAVLGKAARIRKSGWFKSVTWMETTAREIVGPDLAEADATFRATVEQIFDWARDGGG
jgi:putative ATP-dependent endonuclease of the OLD family